MAVEFVGFLGMIRFAVTVIALLLAGTAFAAEEAQVIRLSEPVEQTADSETFGSPLDSSVPAVDLERIAADGERYVGQPVRVEARVSQVCQKKGCFFIAQQGDVFVRVSFKDYGFFVPTDVSGKRVTMVGEVIAKEVTPEEADHFVEDLGEATATLQAGKTYEIVATSVRVPRG
jgi:hypothetical protein